ncbi:hypothetical protein P3W85_38480 [Cupriavidus basilensis]|uniref:Uncharacterized protein n=1 Tax=Cupriavidus basilensis TaxID=68895 RepID=A0ABT6B495_9BURK|nr:hypothetical protein [Cupriavidus basilensis]MDF3838781.1 hypothetical protein [Cupriavidus basilensis]
MKYPLLAALLAAVPALGIAAPLNTVLACGESAHRFIAALQQEHLIETSPMRVEDNSVNAFWPTPDSGMTVLGRSVFAVFGFQPHDALFKAGKGTPLDKPLYGVAVVGGTEAIAKTLAASGSKARAQHAAPFVTAIICD